MTVPTANPERILPMSPRILMCPPDYYGIEYEINPWMSRSRGSDRGRAIEQWIALARHPRGLGVQVEVMTPQPGLPDLVFTANAGLMYRGTFFSAALPARRAGPRDAGLRRLVRRARLHGRASAGGDVLRGGRRRAVLRRCPVRRLSHPQRRSRPPVARAEARRPGPAAGTGRPALLPPRHLLLPAGRRAGDLVSTGVRRLRPAGDRNAGQDADPAAEEEADRFGCNAVVVGKTVVFNAGCPQLAAALTEHGYAMIATPLDEFIKAGGSAKCLTLRLDGEDAAGWRAA